ncbi:spermidine/putrescine transport system permease protein [Anaerobranca californiensis DSM 14826]|jgi:spermidine/putrescine transport system permease protein|uniref:Spermidine/putrescine transport system permease protein n=1 Tax=Anaerobranca californiensis DSM 14826 TaxID=1120989 RepID=A0A1M6MW60_9FIRM|nr:ABC transporter permease [Anaerobranca californiensis]SHJ87738.1 spermidine/putrescine transport system permease protein [Anaerobranca californiensis DSM 14826]
MKKWIAYPYVVFMLIFIVLPLLLTLYYSVTYQDLDGTTRFTLHHFKTFFTGSGYSDSKIFINILLRSLCLALVTTIICLILGYPLAMILSKMKGVTRNNLVLLLIVPMWMNFLIRTYAWMSILSREGILNGILIRLGLPTVNILYTETAVVLGMVYNFLPFMILPIYTVLVKMDKRVLEAAADLGANKFITFTRVIFPLSLPGVISGITMVFMPAVTTFVIPRLLGGGRVEMIGNLIEQQFLGEYNWNFGSAVSIIMMTFILLFMFLLQKNVDKEEEGSIW